MKVFMKIYLVLLIGLGMYAVGYIFGEWLATGQIDLSNLNILLPMLLGLPALLSSFSFSFITSLTRLA
ncbi:TPA: hypothetical protein U1B28_001396 [Streptococcus suis]|uniref:hypothetical protein n=1 Tax=Streptococcus suis TaxID=1307 RepID=UPI00209AC9D7|nr:hypothetical protein [Streptococcus suis]MCO8174977.1 hypothetical protein [Streptococcus suis]MCO8209846.1 hypothetical protein [Streptococcus suis]HEM3473752.1 hypothetical protein [Streptococcus suis]HEM3489789.1 hypothetical protein [Streptococcus suis]HEM3507415.1 hypothetical protein [Streptococcus suis]